MGVVLVTRRECHLCDTALAALRELGIEPEIADVDADDELFRLYDWRVPVVLADGKVVAEGKIDRESLQGLLG
jgi:predicted thioredoxin/glutaredoxin